YMIAGRMRHKDSAGNEGLLQNGGVQWMTAGRGVVHSEMPEQENGVMEGFQLWLNLPSKDKMCTPAYQDLQSEKIPEFFLQDGVKVRVIAGQSQGVAGAVQRPVEAFPTDVLYLDIHFDNEGMFQQTLPNQHNAFLFVYRGAVNVISKAQVTPVRSWRCIDSLCRQQSIADCRTALKRAHCAIWSVCHEHTRRTDSSN
ncbi:MAG: Quercetin 2,3-dioxygenase, partial [Pseudomonadota bacterium]